MRVRIPLGAIFVMAAAFTQGHGNHHVRGKNTTPSIDVALVPEYTTSIYQPISSIARGHRVTLNL